MCLTVAQEFKIIRISKQLLQNGTSSGGIVLDLSLWNQRCGTKTYSVLRATTLATRRKQFACSWLQGTPASVAFMKPPANGLQTASADGIDVKGVAYGLVAQEWFSKLLSRLPSSPDILLREVITRLSLSLMCVMGVEHAC